jgi:hypothetical protein
MNNNKSQLRYIDLDKIDFSKIDLLEVKYYPAKPSNFMYNYPDGIGKKLYIKTSNLRIIPGGRSFKNNKIYVEFPENMHLYNKLIEKTRIFKKYFKGETLLNDSPTMTFFATKHTEIIKHNISSKYPKTEIITENIDKVIQHLNFNNKYEIEGVFIFYPIIYAGKLIFCIYKMEINYKNQKIKSLLQNEKVNNFDILKKSIIEL